MGLDGGTIITRSDVLRGSSWALSKADDSRSTRGGTVSSSRTFKKPGVDAETASTARWTTCSLSGQPLLGKAVVADYLGHLFLKDAVIEYLLARNGTFLDQQAEHRFTNLLRESGDAFDHLQSRRDVFDLQPTELESTNQAPGAGLANACPWGCPVTLLPVGRHSFSALPACGHLLSTKALQQVAAPACSVCGTSYEQCPPVPINGSAQQQAELRRQLPARREASRAGKRKRGAKEAEGLPGSKREGGEGEKKAEGLPGSKREEGEGAKRAEGLPGSKRGGGEGAKKAAGTGRRDAA